MFPSERSLRDRSDTVYFGGPVEIETPGAVFRAGKPARSRRLPEALGWDGGISAWAC